MKPLYLDNAATTPLYPEVAKLMENIATQHYGNPSSPHRLGDEAHSLLTKARAFLAHELGCKMHEIIFTSGGTEANNLALQGLAQEHPRKKKIVISSIEHSSISECCALLENQGSTIMKIPVNNKGLIGLTALEKTLDSSTLLVSIIHANNEIGVLQDLAAIGKLCKERGVFFHTDAVQSFGKERMNVRDCNIDLLSASAHKIGGPRGSGILYVREGIPLQPLFPGAQEAGRRGGTENVPAAAGLAKALELTKKTNMQNMQALRDFFMHYLELLGGIINGSRQRRLANNIHVSFLSIDAEMLVLFLSQHHIFCSTRSACLTQQKKESPVLRAIGLSEKEICGSLRFTLGPETTKKDLQRVLATIERFLRRSKAR